MRMLRTSKQTLVYYLAMQSMIFWCSLSRALSLPLSLVPCSSILWLASDVCQTNFDFAQYSRTRYLSGFLSSALVLVMAGCD